ncbi:SDR family NAD(P)-dependent oxidoreductase, partial [Candidatus Marinimicrobia bacterium]|nr:SDR family NAD(P)-dependent oxidoreductase [Candidatus Neomarinimicrobiota bacterium]
MKKIFITGASSGIGKALALAYAKRGYSVGLTARREEILQDVALACEKLGGIPFVYQLDVQDAEKCKSVAEQFMADAGSIDIAIANAGIGGDDGLFSGDSNQINTILNTNILGVTNTLIPFIPAMKAQNSGSLVCISSVASFMPLPFHGGYSSSKIAIRMIFDSWRPTLQKYMIKTVSICPGFVDTPIVKGPARRFPMKSAEDAAEQFLKVIDLGYSTYIYPWPYRIL